MFVNAQLTLSTSCSALTNWFEGKPVPIELQLTLCKKCFFVWWSFCWTFVCWHLRNTCYCRC